MASTIVVGAGIVGASVSFHLARGGAHVHCVDPRPAGGRLTRASFARLSAFPADTRQKFDLARAGMEEHFRLARDLGLSELYDPACSIAWADVNDGAHGRQLARLRDWGYEMSFYDAEHAAKRYGVNLRSSGPTAQVAHLEAEAWVDPVGLSQLLIGRAGDRGRLDFHHAAVRSLRQNGSRVTGIVLDNGRKLDADVVVNAAGGDVSALAGTAGLGFPQAVRTRSSLVVDLSTEPNALRCVLRAPDLQIRPAGALRVRARSDQVDECFARREKSIADLSRELAAKAGLHIPNLRRAKVLHTRVASATFPSDGLPSAGPLSPLPGYYEICANSGVTVGPLLGRLVADQILRGRSHPLLAPCSPDRLRREPS